MHPGDGVCYAVDSSIVLGTGKRVGVLLDADDMGPFLGEGEGDGVPARASEQVDDGVFERGRTAVRANVFCNLAGENVRM